MDDAGWVGLFRARSEQQDAIETIRTRLTISMSRKQRNSPFHTHVTFRYVIYPSSVKPRTSMKFLKYVIVRQVQCIFIVSQLKWRQNSNQFKY